MRVVLPLLAFIVVVLIGLAAASLHKQSIPDDLRHLSRKDRKAIMADRAESLRRQEVDKETRRLEREADERFQREVRSYPAPPPKAVVRRRSSGFFVGDGGGYADSSPSDSSPACGD